MLRNTVEIGRIIRDAATFDAKNWTGGVLHSDTLMQTVQDLFVLLEQREIAYALVGGIALLRYVEGRNTQDLDLLMPLPALEKLPELEILSQDVYFIRANYAGLQIDVLLTQNPVFELVYRNHAEVQHFLDRDVPVATVMGLLLLKLYALPSLYRQGNFARVGLYENDVATLLHYYPVDVQELLAALSGYVSESDLMGIKDILTDVQGRIARFKGGS